MREQRDAGISARCGNPGVIRIAALHRSGRSLARRGARRQQRAETCDRGADEQKGEHRGGRGVQRGSRRVQLTIAEIAHEHSQ